jgi:hypothetical protein
MSYNGYTNWTRWNVSLWINNDEGLYNLAVEAMNQYRSIHKAADAILQDLRDLGITRTPDGARISRAAIVETLRYWE